MSRVLSCIIGDSTNSHFLGLCYAPICSGILSYDCTSFGGMNEMRILRHKSDATILCSYDQMQSWTLLTPRLVNFYHRLYFEGKCHFCGHVKDRIRSMKAGHRLYIEDIKHFCSCFKACKGHAAALKQHFKFQCKKVKGW